MLQQPQAAPQITPTLSTFFEPIKTLAQSPGDISLLGNLATKRAPVNVPTTVGADNQSVPNPAPIDAPNIDPADPMLSQFSMPSSDSDYAISVYGDQLDPNWQIFTPGGVLFRPGVTDQRHFGATAIQVLPVDNEGKLYITLKSQAASIYPRSEVDAIDFWIYSGDQGMNLFDLAVSAIGSNDYTYYLSGDHSGENEKPYENTFLYYLGFNKDIPPNTWFDVTIWLDQMLYDPHYKYVTGFYVMNRFTFKRMFFIADVSIIVKKHPSTQSDQLYQDYGTTSGVSPSATPTLVPTPDLTTPTPFGMLPPVTAETLTAMPTITPTETPTPSETPNKP